MKKSFFALSFAVFAILFHGCTGDGTDTIVLPEKDRGSAEGNVPSSVIPNSIRTELEIAMPVYSGLNPPNINGQYRVNDLKLNGGNGGGAGTLTDLYLDFSNSANGECTVSYRETRGGVQYGSDNVKGRVVGSGNNFSVYFTTSEGLSYVISGTKTSGGGISNLYYAVVNPNDASCGCSKYSSFKDGDGLTEGYVWREGGYSSSGSQHNVIYGDPVDYQGEIYKTVVIGDQTWMARNLNYDFAGNKCFNSDPTNCDKYGKLYNWATAMDLPSKCNGVFSASDVGCAITTPNHRGICPVGWHLPSYDDLRKLINFVGISMAGRYLKATSGWNDYNGVSTNGEDKYGFAALPGGHGLPNGNFGNVGWYGYWWSASDSEYNATYAFYMYMGSTDGGNLSDNITDKKATKDELKSVRCIKDN